MVGTAQARLCLPYKLNPHRGRFSSNKFSAVFANACMPSHIFTRVGYWKDSIAANQASVQAARGSKELGDQMHGQDYLVYAYLQLGQDKDALGVVSEIEALRPDPDGFAAAFAQAAAPARYMQPTY